MKFWQYWSLYCLGVGAAAGNGSTVWTNTAVLMALVFIVWGKE